MRYRRFRQLMFFLFALILVLAGWGSLRGISDLLLYFQEGADPASALNIVPNRPLDWPVDVTWLPDATDTGREMEPFTREQIEATYIRAWLQWTFSYQKGTDFGLKTYFTGPALEAVAESVEGVAAQGLNMAQVATEHELELHFYSADGSIVSLTDHRATVAQIVTDAEGNTIQHYESTAVYDIVMFLEDGNWRIRHWLRLNEKPPSATQDFALDQYAGVNYYPQATPWDRFWTEYDEAVIAEDFRKMKDLGLNAVRIFIPYEQFGAAEVEQALLDKVEAFLEEADSAEFQVLITLFDFRADYNILTWPNADRHLETILTRFSDHPAILGWDIKNEPDLDYDSNGQGVVDAWLAHTVRLARRFDPSHPITIGWASPYSAATLADELDFVSFHYYDYAEKFGAAYEALTAAVGNKPIMLTEFGLPTWNSLFFPGGHSKPEQAVYYADLLTILRRYENAGYFAWTLYDFSDIPDTVVGGSYRDKAPQHYLGILKTNGDPKPAAALLDPDANLGAIKPLPAYTRFLKPFSFTIALVCFSLITLCRAHIMRNKR